MIKEDLISIFTFQDRRITMMSLVMMDMSWNMMTEVPELLDIASNLETLNMAHNKISRITGL